MVSFLIESPSDLLVMRTTIKSWTSFGSDRTIHMRVTCHLVSHRHIMWKNVVQMIENFIFIWIFTKLADNKDKHKISEFWPNFDFLQES